MTEVLKTGYGIDIPQEFIVNIRNDKGGTTPFIRFPGLERIAHDQAKQFDGLLSHTIQEVLIHPTKENNYTAVIRAGYQIIKDGVALQTAWGIGDANVENAGEIVALHYIRVAATRAMARALRTLTDTGLTALEELSTEQAYQAIAENAQPSSTASKSHKTSKASKAQTSATQATTETKQEQAKQPAAPDKKDLIKQVQSSMKALNLDREGLRLVAVDVLGLPEDAKLQSNKLSEDELQKILARLESMSQG